MLYMFFFPSLLPSQRLLVYFLASRALRVRYIFLFLTTLYISHFCVQISCAVECRI